MPVCQSTKAVAHGGLRPNLGRRSAALDFLEAGVGRNVRGLVSVRSGTAKTI